MRLSLSQPKFLDGNSVVKYWPWQISVAGFWLSTISNFVKDSGAIVPWSDMVTPYVSWYVGIFVLRRDPPSAIDNTVALACTRYVIGPLIDV